MTEPAFWATCGVCGIRIGADTQNAAAFRLFNHLKAFHPNEIGAPQ